MDTPASEVTSLLLDRKTEGRAVEPRFIQQVWLDLNRRICADQLMARAGYTQKVELPCRQ